VTEDHSQEDQSLRWHLKLLNTVDDAAAAVVGAALIESLLVQVIDGWLPNRSRSMDPLSLEGVPLGITPLAKWAYGLGLISRSAYDICRAIGNIRNSAAHLIDSPDFEFCTTKNKNAIDSMITKLSGYISHDEFYPTIKKIYKDRTTISFSEQRIDFDYVILCFATELENSPT